MTKADIEQAYKDYCEHLGDQLDLIKPRPLGVQYQLVDDENKMRPFYWCDAQTPYHVMMKMKDEIKGDFKIFGWESKLSTQKTKK